MQYELCSTVRDKRLTHVEKPKQSTLFQADKVLCFLVLPDVMLAQGKPLRRSSTLKALFMNIIRIYQDVCERLFEELVKELLKDRFTIVSGSFREIDGRTVRVRKAHLRKRKR